MSAKATVWVEVVVHTSVMVEVLSTPEDVEHEAELAAKALVEKALDHDTVRVIAIAGRPEWDDSDDHDAKFDAHHEGGR